MIFSRMISATEQEYNKFADQLKVSRYESAYLGVDERQEGDDPFGESTNRMGHGWDG